MKKVILKIGGMSCSACSAGLEKYLNKQPGIEASVNLVLAQAMIIYEESYSISDLEHLVKEAGYESLGIYTGKEEVKKTNHHLLLYGILVIITLYLSMGHMIGLPSIDQMRYPVFYTTLLCLLACIFLWYGRGILKNGIKNFIHKNSNMDTLVTIGVFSSFLYSTWNFIQIVLGHHEYVENLYFESCVVILYLIQLGRTVDLKNKEKTKKAIQELVQITPEKAYIKMGQKIRETSIDEVKCGDILIAKPGMKIAVDGVITKGSGHFEEAFITGESMPSKKHKNDKVVAGSINLDGMIEYQAEKIGKDSTISEIVRLVVEATNTKAPIARVADQVSGYFVPGIMLIAIFTLLAYICLGRFEEAIVSFVTVLVVACPCALGLATPLAIVISEGKCAKLGILVKNSETLENAHKVDTIVFDKTGTLTYGTLQIAKIHHYNAYKDDELIKLVSSIEVNSTHPIHSAFTSYAKQHHLQLLECMHFENIAGIGVKGTIQQKEYYIGNGKLFHYLQLENLYLKEEQALAQDGDSIVYVIENDKVIGLIGVKDEVRKDAKQTIKELIQMNKEVIMLTGDHEITASRIASALGISKVIANVIPSEKTKVIQELLKQGKHVMMIGDGINDAPSLAVASIGVSMKSGTDIASDSADVILMQNHLDRIPLLMLISKKTIRNIKQNLFWAFFYNICMLPLAIGFLKPYGIVMNPMLAGFAMTLSSLTVVWNALRLRK